MSIIKVDYGNVSGGLRRLVVLSKGSANSSGIVTLSNLVAGNTYYLLTGGFSNTTTEAHNNAKVSSVTNGTYQEVDYMMNGRSGYIGGPVLTILEPANTSVSVTLTNACPYMLCEIQAV